MNVSFLPKSPHLAAPATAADAYDGTLTTDVLPAGGALGAGAINDDATNTSKSVDATDKSKAGGSVPLAVANVMKDAFSVSSLGLAYATLQAGLGLGLLLLLLIGLGSWYTGVLLVDTAKLAARLPALRGQRVTSYMELGAISLGRGGQALVAVVSVLTCLGAAGGWFIAIGDALSSAVPHISYSGWIGLSLAVVVPLSLPREVHYMGYASVLACFTYIGLLVLIVERGVANMVSHEAVSVPTSFFPSSSHGTAFLLSFGIVKFCYAGHEVFLTVEQNLSQPDLYNRVVAFAFGGMMCINTAMAIAGLCVFGALTESNILFNLDNSGLGYAARLLVGVMLILTVPIVLLAAFEMVEDVLWRHVFLVWPCCGRARPAKDAPKALASASADALNASGGLVDSGDVRGQLARVSRALDSSRSAHSINSATTTGSGERYSPLETQPSPRLSRPAGPSARASPRLYPKLPDSSTAADDAGAMAGRDPTAAPHDTEPAKDLHLGWRALIRIPLTLVSVCIALTLPSFARVVGLVGAVGDSTIGLLLPVIFRLCVQHQLRAHGLPVGTSVWERVANGSVLALGVVGIVSGIAILWS